MSEEWKRKSAAMRRAMDDIRAHLSDGQTNDLNQALRLLVISRPGDTVEERALHIARCLKADEHIGGLNAHTLRALAGREKCPEGIDHETQGWAGSLHGEVLPCGCYWFLDHHEETHRDQGPVG